MSEQDHNVSGSRKISGIFSSLSRNRALLTAEFDRGESVQSTLVLQVNLAEGTCLLDTFSNPEILDAALEGKPFSLRGSDNGVQMYCSGLVAHDMIEHGDGHALIVNLPEHLIYRQRRSYFRLKLGTLSKVTATMSLTPAQIEDAQSHLQDGEDAPSALEGVIDDLSGRGARLIFQQQKFPLPAPEDDETVDITITLPERDDSMVFKAIWRHRKHSIASETLTVGLEFVGLDDQEADQIQRYVVRMQFEQRAQSVM